MSPAPSEPAAQNPAFTGMMQLKNLEMQENLRRAAARHQRN
jgi:hypothetical protein